MIVVRLFFVVVVKMYGKNANLAKKKKVYSFHNPYMLSAYTEFEKMMPTNKVYSICELYILTVRVHRL